MAVFDNFAVASQRYFEPMSLYNAGSEYRDVVSPLLPADWALFRHDVWLNASMHGWRPPNQGFKIHISTTAAAAEDVLKSVVPICLRCHATFKLAADRRILGMLNAKRCARGSSGKFMTVYPRDIAHFVALIDDIHEATRDFTGPYILSDRRYKDSRVVFYRYGGFIRRARLLADGTTRPVIDGPDNSIIDDERTPFFSLPRGIIDPLPTPPGTDTNASLPLLQGRFQVTDALAFSNSGGVYTAIDRASETTVIVKEARPHTHSWTDGSVSFDSVSLLRREHETLRALGDLLIFPKPIALFQEWEHWFLVEEFAHGEPLRTYRARDDLIVMAHIYDPGWVASFADTFRTIANHLIAVLDAVHARGVILADISPNNVLIDPDSLAIRIIDLESACRLNDVPAFAAFARVWRTPGFREPSRYDKGAPLAPIDDWYALGMLLHGLIIPIEGLVDLYPQAIPRFLGRFVDAGLPRFVQASIMNLLEGDVGAARRELLP